MEREVKEMAVPEVKGLHRAPVTISMPPRDLCCEPWTSKAGADAAWLALQGPRGGRLPVASEREEQGFLD